MVVPLSAPQTYLRPLLAALAWSVLASPSLAETSPKPPASRLGGQILLEAGDGESGRGPGVKLAQATEPVEEAQPLVPPDLDEAIWSGTLELYGFLPLTTNSTTTIRGLSADSEISAADLVDALGFAAAGRASLERGRIGLLVDADYARIGAEDSTLVGRRQGLRRDASIRYTQGFYDLALRYRFGERESAVGDPGQFSLIPYAGARLVDLSWDIDASLELLPRTFVGPLGVTRSIEGRTVAAQRSFSRTWVQPLVGLQGSVFLSPRLRAFGRADLAGFGLAGEDDLSYNLQAGLGYAVGNSTDLTLSWRTRGLTWNNGGDPDSGYRTYNYGLEMGLKFFFGGRPTPPPVATLPPEPAPQVTPEPEPLPEPAPQPVPIRGLW